MMKRQWGCYSFREPRSDAPLVTGIKSPSWECVDTATGSVSAWLLGISVAFTGAVNGVGFVGARGFWIFLYLVRMTPFFLQTSTKCPSISQCVRVVGNHSYVTCWWIITSSSLKKSIWSGNGPSMRISIKSLAYCRTCLSFVNLSVLIGIPRMLPILLKLSFPQYLISSAGS